MSCSIKSAGHRMCAGNVLCNATLISNMRQVGSMGAHVGEYPYAYHITAMGRMTTRENVKDPPGSHSTVVATHRRNTTTKMVAISPRGRVSQIITRSMSHFVRSLSMRGRVNRSCSICSLTVTPGSKNAVTLSADTPNNACTVVTTKLSKTGNTPSSGTSSWLLLTKRLRCARTSLDRPGLRITALTMLWDTFSRER
eukprot:2995894-Rhodomonas_salina.1